MEWDDLSDIQAYYDSDPENECQRLARHQLEFDITWRYLSQYLPSQAQILEVGAATGRYTLPLAQAGHQITAVDLTPKLLDYNRKQLTEAGLADRVQYLHRDARALRNLPCAHYDVVLVMGPFYHLIQAQERALVLRETLNYLRPGGYYFSAWISRYGLFADLLKKWPQWVGDAKEVESLLTQGRDDNQDRAGGFRGYFATVAEIPRLHEAAALQTQVLAAVEPCIGNDDASYNRLQGRLREQWLDLFFRLSVRPELLGSSRHLLYIGQKPPKPILK